MPVTPSLVRFGVFELDLSTGELSKNGRKLRLQEQPFRLLRLLLEHPGQAVPRERLKEALWPADTYVDFDHGLNAAVAKLRLALGDSAENPRFIETLARRGYRFIAPIDFVGCSNGTGIAALAIGAPVQVAPVATKRKWIHSLAYAAGVLTLTAIVLWLGNRKPSGETELVQLTEDTGLTTDPAVSPDGKLLAYASDRGSNGILNIWIQQLVPGGGAVQLTHDSVDASEPAFSPDGTRIVFCSKKDGGGIYTVPVIGGEATRLTQSGRHPRFSPDGHWISYVSVATDSIVSAVGAVYVIPSFGGKARRLGSDLPATANPVWSADSEHLLVCAPLTYGLAWNETDWWLVPLDGARSRPTGAFRELRRQGFSLGFDRIPQASQWTKDFITFSAVFGDAVNVFRAPISREGHIIGRAVRLTSGTTTEISPTLTANGEVIFASLNRNLAVWSLSSDSDHGKVAGELKRITQSAAAIMPSISADGRVLTFTAVRRRTGVSSDLAIPDEKRHADVPAWFPDNAAELQIVLKILVTGKETVLSTADIAEWHPQISRDGSMVAYTSGKEGHIYAARVNGGPIKMIVSGGLVWDWSLDNKRLLFNVHKNAEVHAVDLSTGNEKLFLSRPGYSIFQTRFSPDDRAIALVGCWQQHDRSPPQCQIYVVPIENGMPLPWQSWIAIDHAGHWDDKPRWSPNGELIYFISDRDGYLCLWAQRVEKATKRLVGFPFPVYHFHNSRLAMANMGTCPLEFDVAKDKMVFGLGELSGNIWALRQK